MRGLHLGPVGLALLGCPMDRGDDTPVEPSPTATTAATAETGMDPTPTGTTGTTGMTADTGSGPPMCLQELALVNGLVDALDDTVTVGSTLAIGTNATVPLGTLPPEFEDARYHGAVSPLEPVPWWDGWTLVDPAIDGSPPGPAFHPLEAEITAGTVQASVANVCSLIDPSLGDGGTVTVFGQDFPVCIVSQDILSTQTWPNNHVFLLTDTITIGEGTTQYGGGGPSATLTIQAGTQVYAVPGPTSLVASRGSQLVAQGTPELPILFASVAGDETGILGDPTVLTERGAWGGVVLSGRGPSNRANGDGEQLTEFAPVDADRWYGGTNNGDGSGTLRYVIVAEGGIEVRPGVVMPSFAFETVGSDTLVDFVQSIGGEGHCLQWLGGAVTVRHAWCSGPGQNGFDADHGFMGGMQYGIVRLGATHGHLALETDNNDDDFDIEPRTSAVYANLTLLGNAGGPEPTTGVRHQQGDRSTVLRSVVADDALAGGAFENGCLDIDDGLGPVFHDDGVFDCTPRTAAACEVDEELPMP